MEASGQIQVPDAINRWRYGGVGSRMDPRTDDYVLEKSKISFSYRKSSHISWIVQLVV